MQRCQGQKILERWQCRLSPAIRLPNAISNVCISRAENGGGKDVGTRSMRALLLLLLLLLLWLVRRLARFKLCASILSTCYHLLTPMFFYVIVVSAKH